jgi:hypothetical protein
MSGRETARPRGALAQAVRPPADRPLGDPRQRGRTRVVELIRVRATDLRDRAAVPRAGAKAKTGESRVVRSLMIGLLPAGLLWLTVFSLLRGLLG